MCAMQGEGIESGTNQHAWDKWSNDGIEQEVPKLMEEDVGASGFKSFLYCWTKMVQ